MSEEQLITLEDIERLKSRDSRWKDVDLAIQIDEELRTGAAINLLLIATTRRADEALEKLVEVSPTDAGAIAAYQAEVRYVKFIAETIERVRTNGLHAAASLESEEKVVLEGEEYLHG